MLRCHFCHFWLARVHTWGPALSVRRANNSSRILPYESIDVQMHFRTARLHTSGDWYDWVLTTGDVRPQQAHCFLVYVQRRESSEAAEVFFLTCNPEEKHVLKRHNSWTGSKVQNWHVQKMKRSSLHIFVWVYFSFSVYSLAPPAGFTPINYLFIYYYYRPTQCMGGA
jgi:hypothetical protein